MREKDFKVLDTPMSGIAGELLENKPRVTPHFGVDLGADLSSDQGEVVEVETSSKLDEQKKVDQGEVVKPLDPDYFCEEKQVVFDPEIHQKQNGKPRRKKGGGFVPKGGRKKGKLANGKSKIVVPQPKIDPDLGADLPSDQAEVVKVDTTAAGAAAAAMFFTAGMAIGGDEWQPEKNEQEYVSKAFSDYLATKDISQLNPTHVLIFSLLSYSGQRVTKPKTKDSLSRAFLWLKGKAYKVFDRIKVYRSVGVEKCAS